jgi:hypothetical protein
MIVSWETFSEGLKFGKFGPGLFLKALDATPRNLSSNRSEGFKLTSFESFQQIKSLWR